MFNSKREQVAFYIFMVIVVCFLLVAPYVILPKIYSNRNEWQENAPINAKFLELWEIDTFEGGSSSRAKFLEKVSYQFQDITLSNYVLVRSVNLEQAKEMLQNGTRPDIISYGIGTGEMIEGICSSCDVNLNVRADLLVGGIKNSKIYGVPWCFGGYCLCSYDEQDFLNDNLELLKEQTDKEIIGTGYEYNVPKLSLNKSDESLLDKTTRTQYQAYDSFIRQNEFKILLGTQRDFYRLNNKVKLGVIDNIKFKFLNLYTDLIQYFSITTLNNDLESIALDYIEFVLSANIQKTLTNIGMFSVNRSDIYDNEYSDFEKALENKLQVMNVFTPNIRLLEYQNGGNCV